jgi:hypothetical protein
MKKLESDVQKRIKELKRITKNARDARLRAVLTYKKGQEYWDSLPVKDREFLFESGLGQQLCTAVRILGEVANLSKD